jgi:hypothetical protein
MNAEPVKPIIVLDIDGVLNTFVPVAERSADWKWDPEFRSDRDSGRFLLNLSTEMARALEKLGELRWLTTWIYNGDQANPNVGAHFGWNLPLLDIVKDTTTPRVSIFERPDPWWKSNSIKKLCAEPGPPVVWIDDDIEWFLRDGPQDLDPHHRLFCVCPDADVGITRAHIEMIKNHLELP